MMVTYSGLAIWELQTTVRHKPNEVFAGEKNSTFCQQKVKFVITDLIFSVRYLM